MSPAPPTRPACSPQRETSGQLGRCCGRSQQVSSPRHTAGALQLATTMALASSGITQSAASRRCPRFAGEWSFPCTQSRATPRVAKASAKHCSRSTMPTTSVTFSDQVLRQARTVHHQISGFAEDVGMSRRARPCKCRAKEEAPRSSNATARISTPSTEPLALHRTTRKLPLRL